VLLGLLDRVWCIFSKVVWRSKHRIRSIQLSLSFMFKHVALPFIHHKLLQFMGIASTKWKSSYDKGRKYNNNRENTFIWLKKANDGSEGVYCKLCHIAIIPRHSNFMNHEKKKKHKNGFHQQDKLPSKSCYLTIWLFLDMVRLFLKRCLATLQPTCFEYDDTIAGMGLGQWSY